MKKLLVVALVPFVFLAGISFVQAESPVQKVYKIKTYELDKTEGIYRETGYGSAVLIGNNRIITNAHVVLNDDEKPLGTYNLCISESFENIPVCKTALKLIKYDIENDLALLEPIANVSLGTPVEISMRKLDLGEVAKFYGYPANGGDTITLTEGKISGLTNGRYKVDANIDAGNSGGGAFDRDGKFIGIPYAASVGYSTLGYIIPVTTMQEFLDGKGDITAYGKTDSKFTAYIDTINTRIMDQQIKNSHIQFDGFGKKGFTLTSAQEHPNGKIANYTLLSKTRNTSIEITLANSYGEQYIPYVRNIKDLRLSYQKVLEKKNITIGGKKIESLIGLIGEKKSDGAVDSNVVSLIFSMEGLDYRIDTKNYNTEKQAISSAITLFVKNLKYSQPSIINIQSYSYSVWQGDILKDMTFQKLFQNDEVTNIFYFTSNKNNIGTIQSSTQDVSQETTDEVKKTTFESFILREVDISGYQAEIKKNTLGTYYLHLRSTSKAGAVEYSDTFYSIKDGKSSAITISYEIAEADLGLDFKYSTFIDTIKLNGDFPFKSAKTGTMSMKE